MPLFLRQDKSIPSRPTPNLLTTLRLGSLSNTFDKFSPLITVASHSFKKATKDSPS